MAMDAKGWTVNNKGMGDSGWLTSEGWERRGISPMTNGKIGTAH